MNLDLYDAEWIALSLHIGNGREAPDGGMTLSLEYRASSDLCWLSTQHPATMWSESQAFTEWLAADYPGGMFTDYDPHLYPLLTTLGLVQADNFFYQMRFTPETLELSYLEKGWYPLLTLHRENMRLPLILKDWSWASLCQLTANWNPWDSHTGQLNVPFTLNVGYCLLTVEQVRVLQVGDGIVIQEAAAIFENRLWLTLQEKRIVMSVNENELQVVSIEEDMPPCAREEQLTSLNSVPLKVVAEVGVAQLSLNELAALKPGTVLPTKVTLSGKVRLTINGAYIGQGRLIALNDGMVVRIDFLANGALSRPVAERAKADEQQEGDDDGMVA